MKVDKSPNQLYKICIQPGIPTRLQAKIGEVACRWHTRLGHVNFDNLKHMQKKEIVRHYLTLTKKFAYATLALLENNLDYLSHDNPPFMQPAY